MVARRHQASGFLIMLVMVVMCVAGRPMYRTAGSRVSTHEKRRSVKVSFVLA